jgi:hypothetical protein
MNTQLSNLSAEISAYDSSDVLASIAGLQLMPENIESTIRLEVLAHVAASIPYCENKSKMSGSKLRKLCNSSVPDDLIHMEDPFECPFTEEISFFGGSYVVFPGYGGDSAFVIRHLLKSIFLQPHEFGSQEFIAKARNVISAILLISNEIAQRIGHRRGTKPISSNNGKVVIPDNSYLKKLKCSVSFDQDALVKMLAKNNIDLSVIDRIVAPIGEISISDYKINNGFLLTHPIVKVRAKYIIAIPGILLWALRTELIHLAVEYNVLRKLADTFNFMVMNSAVEHLGFMGNDLYPGIPFSPIGIPYFNEGLLTLDRDKIIYLIVFTDSLDNYDFLDINGIWQTDNLYSIIYNRFREVSEFLFSTDGAPNDIFFLFLFQGVGRMFILGFNEQLGPFGSHILTMSVSDLETIALIESKDPLTLWRYANASDKIRTHTRVMKADELDEYQFYRKNHYSYYFSDDERPNALVISPGGAGEIRIEASEKRDIHGATSYIKGYIMDVIALHGDRKFPIYIPKFRLIDSSQASILVEGYALPIWILGPLNKNNNNKIIFYERYFDFADSIAYWLWQFTPSLFPPTQAIASRHKCIVVDMVLQHSDLWMSDKNVQLDENNSYITINSDLQTGHINITFNIQIKILLERPDNIGERYFMKHLLHGIQDLLHENEKKYLSDEMICTIINRHMPIGIKKKIINISSNNALDLDPNGVPPFRKLQDADVSDDLDLLGEHLILSAGYNIGRIEDKQRTFVLNEIVSKFYFNKLKRLTSSLKPDELLEWLISHHESIINRLAEHKLTTPTRIALFNSDTQMNELISKEFNEINEAAVASRFVIEYIATQPPNGLRLMSYSVYDQLQAIAANIIRFGFMSDLIHTELADIKLNILPSRRLGSEKSQFEKARAAYLPNFLSGEIVRRTNYFEYYWKRQDVSVEKSEFDQKIDDACSFELGFYLTEILDFIAETIRIGQELSPVVACLPFDELVEKLTSRLGWKRNKVIRAIEMLSLEPRIDFSRPESPHRIEDTYPWRFNRSLSYLRRPFIIRNYHDNAEILWGIRHLYDSGNNILGLIMSGRWKAHSNEMKMILSKINNNRGANFNIKIFELFSKNPNLIVKMKVKKIDKLQIRDSKGRDLGDIDVLVINPKKRSIEVIECKNLSLARTPREMKIELENLFGREDYSKSIIGRHNKRINWIREHVDEVLLWLKLPFIGKWKVKPLIVVDIELITPYVQKSKIDIKSYNELVKELGTSKLKIIKAQS